MKERPILFSAPMVRALLAGTKTQTRRIAKVPDNARSVQYWAPPSGRSQSGWAAPGVNYWTPDADERTASNHLDPCPYGQPGDRLWVREAFGDCTKGADIMAGMHYDPPLYRADADAYGLLGHDGLGPVYDEEIRWRPSIHMPRKFSRITLEITGVRVERLQDISAGDCWAEGIPFSPDVDPIHEYESLWEQINGPGSWEANPWVWVVEFKRVTP